MMTDDALSSTTCDDYGQERPRLLTARREQVFFRPVDLESLLAPDHPARVVWAALERVDLAAFYSGIKAVEGNSGRPAIDPKILLALWLFATSEGVGSARKIDRLCEEHDAYRWLCGGVSVNYHTLSDFRSGHEAALDDLMARLLAVLMDQGLVDLKRVAQDGVRTRASAGAASFQTRDSLKRCLSEAQEQVRRLRDLREADDDDRSSRSRAAQERAAREREERLQRAIDTLPEAGRTLSNERRNRPEHKDKQPKVSTTDHEARVMKMSDGGFRPAYNPQLATDMKAGFIVGVQATNHGTDSAELPPMLDQLKARCGRLPEAAVADGGYATRYNIDQAAARGVDVYVPVRRPKDPQKDRYAPRYGDSPSVKEWRRRMQTDEARELIRQRPAIAEWANAHARAHTLSHFFVRGLAKVRCVLMLVALTHNILRMHSLAASQPA